MNVFIPSYGRAGRVTTLAMLPPHVISVLCVRQSQAKAYRDAYRNTSHANYGIEILIIPDKYKGIAGARTWICRVALRGKLPVIAMLDDDMIGGWFYKKDSRKFGGLKKATPEQVNHIWKYHEKMALRYGELYREGYAISLSDRRILAYGRPKIPPSGIKIGLIGRCIILNTRAMQTAQFTINACEDVESTLAWLKAGVMCGQDIHFGHGGHKEWARSKEAGGVGALRAKQVNLKTQNHRRLMKLFPGIVGYTSTGKERTSYWTAAKMGGLV